MVFSNRNLEVTFCGPYRKLVKIPLFHGMVKWHGALFDFFDGESNMLENTYVLLLSPPPKSMTLITWQFQRSLPFNFPLYTISRILGRWGFLGSKDWSKSLETSRSMAASSYGWVWQIGKKDLQDRQFVPSSRTSTENICAHTHTGSSAHAAPQALLHPVHTSSSHPVNHLPRESSLPVAVRAGSGVSSCCFQRPLCFLSF